MKIEIGKTKNNESIFINFNESHNVFIAGACGSGKSVLEHLMIKEINKQDCNSTFLLIDPKHVEFYKYKDIKNFMVFKDNSFRDELKRIIKDRTYNNIYIFFDEYMDNLFDDKSLNDDVLKLLRESKNRDIHVIVSSQKGGSEEFFSKQFINAFNLKIVLRLLENQESINLILNNDACELKGCGDAIMFNRNKETFLRINYETN